MTVMGFEVQECFLIQNRDSAEHCFEAINGEPRAIGLNDTWASQLAQPRP